ncbi:MAG: STE24 endopeptidase [Verrucomicrobiales bacterium]|jgi:STE24 endopeptidase
MEINVYFIIIFAAVFVFYKLDLFSEMLNLKALKGTLPKEFDDVFDAEAYEKSQDYTRVRTTFGMVEASFGLVVFICFWLFGGFGFVNGLVTGWFDGPIVQGLAFCGLLLVGQQLLSLPFEIYSTFVIEERFGFNKTTPKTFVVDMIKGLVLGAIIGAPLLALILWIFGAVAMAWLWAFILVAAFTLFLTYIAPTWIMPLFNKFEPLEDGELKDEINKMAEKCDFPLTELSVMDGSKRSAKSNAFFTGLGKNKKIALFDTLIEKHTTPELVAVLAHEIGHFKRKHILQSLVVGMLNLAFTFFLLSLFIGNGDLLAAFGIKGEGGAVLAGKDVPVYLSLIFFGMLFQPISKLTSIFMTMLSRKNEFEADAYAAEVTGNPDVMISALKKLSKDNLSNLTPHPFYVFLNYSHPPVLQRIEALRAKAS